MSRYERELNDRPLAALEYIAPEVLAPEMAQAFLSAVQKKQIKSGAGAPHSKDGSAIGKKGGEASLDCEPRSGELSWPCHPLSLLSSFNDPIITDKTALCVIELANIFLALKQTEKALDLADKVGRQFPGLPQVAASETSGDIMIESRLYEKSITFYELALKFLEKYSYDHKNEEKFLELIKESYKQKIIKKS